jgi:hypothetical protein
MTLFTSNTRLDAQPDHILTCTISHSSSFVFCMDTVFLPEQLVSVTSFLWFLWVLRVRWIALMMEAVRTSETSVYYNETTRWNIPDGAAIIILEGFIKAAFFCWQVPGHTKDQCALRLFFETKSSYGKNAKLFYRTGILRSVNLLRFRIQLS